MGERYWITGVQLGLLIGFTDRKERLRIVEEIEDKQFIGNTNSAPNSQETKPSTSSICDNSTDVGKANRLRVDKPLDTIHKETIKEENEGK